MNDADTKVVELKEIMQKFVDDRNWSKYHHPKDLAMAISIEANELLELFLWKNISLQKILSNQKLLDEIKFEIADIFAYILSIVNILNLDLTSIFVEKMKINEKKYSADKFNGNYEKVNVSEQKRD